jgi:hypothetical protein
MGFSSAFVTIFAIAGMLNNGPLAKYLYKVSVQSRGDFWRSAFDMANSNPFFGVGIDSFYDSFLLYRDQTAVNHPFAEMTDNAHNYFLQYAATCGYPLAFLQLFLTLLCVYNAISLLRKKPQFDKNFTIIFCAWIVFQLQALISPGNIVLMIWGAILSGLIIGLNSKEINQEAEISKKDKSQVSLSRYVLAFLAILCMFPLINNDRQLLSGLKNGDGNKVIASLKSYPESSANYNQFGLELLRSNLQVEALDVGYSAVKFNPNSAAAWALILINPSASIEVRKQAKEKIIQLDPLNKEVFKFNF